MRISWLLHGAVILFCGAAGYVAWLDYHIQARFTGAKWSLPARVYAAPVELFTGQALTPAALEQILRDAGYRQAANLAQPGAYRRTGAALEFSQREFDFWDGRQPARLVRAEFRRGKVQRILDQHQGRAVPLVRLEPELIGRIYPNNFEDRVLVAYADVPAALIDALLAVEDRNFFQHAGVDVKGILRALFHNVFRGRVEQGGSTITQQLVKNFFLTRERTIARKVNEIIMALLLERRYEKTEILAAYINEVYLGQQGKRSVHGFGAGAEFYFARPLDELRLDQLALLVGMVKGASFYNPRRHPARARERRDLVLELMFGQGRLDAAARTEARSRSLDLSARPRWVAGKHPAFLQLVKSQLLREYAAADLRARGLRIFTTLDAGRQNAMELSLRRQLRQMEREKSLAAGTLQAASVFVQSSSGAVVALAGDRNAEYAGFNRATQARRPIGSLVKPFVYYTALARPQQYSLAAQVDDAAVSVKLANGEYWRPDNYDGRNHGRVTLMEALAKSYNRATVRLGREVGVRNVIAALEAVGIGADIKPFPSVLLGSLELTPLQVSQAYQVLANGGFFAPLNSIREVLDSDGRALKRYALEVRRALRPEATHLVNYALVQAVRHGTGRGLHSIIPDGLPLAGKTGTTNDLRDSWFAGFDDEITGVVWLGRDDNRPTRYTGAGGAMRLWGDIMKQQRQARPVALSPPPGVGALPPLRLPFAGACVRFSDIPYLLSAPPGPIDEC